MEVGKISHRVKGALEIEGVSKRCYDSLEPFMELLELLTLSAFLFK